jgi:hypothetical protein
MGCNGQWEKADLVINVVRPDRVHPDHLVGQLNGRTGWLKEKPDIAYRRVNIIEVGFAGTGEEKDKG